MLYERILIQKAIHNMTPFICHSGIGSIIGMENRSVVSRGFGEG